MISNLYSEHINIVHLIWESVVIEHVHNFIP